MSPVSALSLSLQLALAPEWLAASIQAIIKTPFGTPDQGLVAEGLGQRVGECEVATPMGTDNAKMQLKRDIEKTYPSQLRCQSKTILQGTGSESVK